MAAVLARSGFHCSFVVEQFGGRYGQRDGIRARLGQSSGGQNPVDGGLLSPSDGTEVARVSSTVGGAMAVLVRACRCADARGMSGEPPRLAPNTIRRTIFDQVHNVTGSPCCGATPAGTTPWAPLNVAPCRRYSDASPPWAPSTAPPARAVYAMRLGSFVAALLLAAVYPCATPEDR